MTRRAAWLSALHVFVLILLCGMPLQGQVGGVWSGSYSLPGVPAGELRIDITSLGSAAIARVDAGGFSRGPAVGSIEAGELRALLMLADGTPVEFHAFADRDELIGTLRTQDGRSGTALLSRVARPSASANVTGTWSGNGSISFTCDYNQGTVTVPVSGNVSVILALFQTNGSVAGTIELDNVPNTDSQCHVVGTLPPLIGPVAGSIANNTLTATASLPGDKGPFSATFTATVNGTSMSFSGSGVSATLNQSSTQAPDSSLTGTWSGTVTSTFIPCGTQPAITYTANLSGSFVQAGNIVTGGMTLTNAKSDQLDSAGRCIVVDKPSDSTSFVGQLNGNTLTGTSQDLTSNDKTILPFTATVSGNTITGSVGGKYPGEGATFTLTRGSTTPPAPVVLSFSPNQSTIGQGGNATLSWATMNSVGVTIDQGIGAQAVYGSVNVSPKQTTTYTLTATGVGGTATAATTVTVLSPGQLVVSALPSGMLQAVNGGPSSDRFSVTNTGGADATANVSVSSNVFSVSPSSITIPGQSTQVFVVQAAPQPAGTYTANVTISGGGLPQPLTLSLTLVVATAPTGSVLPQAAAPRVDVTAPQGQNPTGSVSFTNSGTAALQGIAVSDVPWIVPQSGVITIAPGATQSVSFTIDRSKRPDNAGPVGGLTGKLSLLYLGSGSSKGMTTLGTTPTSSISVNIVDTVKPGTTPGGPPPLQAGEVALWVDGLASTSSNRTQGDLFFANGGSLPSINDLKLYYGGSSNPSAQTSSIPQFVPNVAFSVPAVMKNVFGVTGAVAFLQLRSSDAANLSVTGLHLTTTADRKASFIGAVPTLRSDRSIGPGERTVITGLEVTPTAADAVSASVYIQEVSGNSAAIQLDYRDGNGNSVGTDTATMTPFSFAGGTIPANAASVVVANTSTNGARVAAYGTVDDAVTNDQFTVVDPSRAAGVASDTLIVPVVTSSVSGQTTSVYVTNNSGAPVSAGIEVITESNRRHAVRFSAGSRPQAVQPTTLNPLQTARIAVPAGTGFVRITGPAGGLSVTGRVTIPGFGGSYGTSLPAVPAGAGLGNGQRKRFTAVDDASDASIASRTAATYRSSLILIEAAGQSATVRVTLRYAFPAGSLVTAQAASSKDFLLSARQMLSIPDLARSIIGAQRNSFGDLRNMILDVSVIDGAGKIVPFVVSTDNGSGDLVVRAE